MFIQPANYEERILCPFLAIRINCVINNRVKHTSKVMCKVYFGLRISQKGNIEAFISLPWNIVLY